MAAPGFVARATDRSHGPVTNQLDEAGTLLPALTLEQAARDRRGATTFPRGKFGGSVGMIGFCQGGARSLFAAGHNGDALGLRDDLSGGPPNVTGDWSGRTAPFRGSRAENNDSVHLNVPGAAAAPREPGQGDAGLADAGTALACCRDTNRDGGPPGATAPAWPKTGVFGRAHR